MGPRMTMRDVERGLWGHKGLSTAPSRQTIITLLSLSLVGYMFSLLINGASGKLLRPRFQLPARSPTADPLGDGMCWVVRVLDPMFLLTTFRAVAAWLLCGAMWARNDVPWATGAQGVRADALRLRPAMWVPFVVGLCNSFGYLFYMALTARGGVSIWSALVGLYICIPVLYGICVKGEARTPRKLAGICVCVLASVLLGYSEELKDASSEVSRASNAALYLVCVLLWGCCDALSAYMGRDLHLLWVTALTGLGFAAAAALCSVVAFFVTAEAPALAAPAAGGGGMSSAGGYLLMAAAQASGVGAWYVSVKLGVLAEGSAFLPIISLYTMGASLLAVPALGENNLPPLFWVGVVVGTAGIALISWGGEKGGGAGGGRGATADADAATAAATAAEGADVGEQWEQIEGIAQRGPLPTGA